MRLAEVAGDALFDAGGRTWRWGDLFLAVRLWGDWDPWAASIAAPARTPDPKAAEVAFRRERGLLSADELRSWLERNRLTVDDWRGYLRGEPAESPWTAGVCSGAFDAWGDRLAERAAAAAADPPLGLAPPPPAWFGRMPSAPEAEAIGVPAHEVGARAEQLWLAERAHERLCAAAAASDAVARIVTANNVDWLRVDCQLIEAADEDVAREAALLVREDGMALPDVARVAGLALHSDRVYVGELPADLRPRLVSAAPGELVGPVAANGHFVIAHVRGKLVPTLDDPDIRARAERAATAAELERAVHEQVRWHGRE